MRATDLRSSGPCRPHTLAESPGVIVHRCADCRGITVHVGAFSVRMDESAFLTLVGTLVAAHGALVETRAEGVLQ